MRCIHAAPLRAIPVESSGARRGKREKYGPCVTSVIYIIDFFQSPWIPAAPTQPVIYKFMLSLAVFLGGVNFMSWAALQKQTLNSPADNRSK